MVGDLVAIGTPELLDKSVGMSIANGERGRRMPRGWPEPEPELILNSKLAVGLEDVGEPESKFKTESQRHRVDPDDRPILRSGFGSLLRVLDEMFSASLSESLSSCSAHTAPYHFHPTESMSPGL